MTSAFGKLDKNDLKRLGIEAAVAAGIAAVGVIGAYATNHMDDLGITAPVVIYLSGLAISTLKKLLTDNTKTDEVK